jgi:serine/threonine protein kinase
MLLKPGEHVSGAAQSYEIVEILGQGTYGTVFRARDENANFVVIKQLFDTGSASKEDFEYQRKLFWREAEILSQINHPKIVHFIERLPDLPTPPEGQDLFLVMELVQGTTLRKVFDDYRIKNNSQPFPGEVATAVGIELCEALHYLHTLPGQIIYRDLKPENVMWDSVAQKCKLIDFGTARFSDKSRRATQGLGTEGYAPPELYSTRAEVTFSADVFTIGALMYELLTGETPEPKSTPRDFRGFDPQIPPALQKIVLRALQIDPQARYQSAGEMGDALKNLHLAPDQPALESVGAPKATNLHPLLSCFCPNCGAVPRTDRAIYCGKCRHLIHTVMLRILPKNSPPTLLYLQKNISLLGRTDPDSGVFPDVDLSRFDAGRFVSRKHAVIKREGVKWFLTAQKTLNPTRANGFVVAEGATVPLQDGARLEFADLVCNFVIKPVVNP